MPNVHEVWIEKQPPKPAAKKSAIVNTKKPFDQPHLVLFEEINGQLIRDTILKMYGAAGPLGLNAASWKCLCAYFKRVPAELCDSLAATARRTCTSYVDLSGLTAFVKCLLIALNKYPGVSPIVISETARRVIDQAIAKVLSDDIQKGKGPLQLRAGSKSGCEAAVDAMRELLETEATILSHVYTDPPFAQVAVVTHPEVL